jgi:hypothetical protein
MTDELEDSDRSRIRQLIQDTVQQPMLGVVSEVFSRTEAKAITNTDGDTLGPSQEPPADPRPSNHEVTVEAPPGIRDQVFERCPVMTPTSGVVTAPRKDDLVLLIFGSRADKPFAIGNFYADSDDTRSPIAEAGSIRLRREPLYVELAPDGSSARIAKKTNEKTIPADAADADAEVSISDSGNINIATDEEGANININAEGDVNISAGGRKVSVSASQIVADGNRVNISGNNVVIDEGGDPKKVLTEDAVFEYQQRIDTDDGTGGTATKKTTTVVNKEITETDIE